MVRDGRQEPVPAAATARPAAGDIVAAILGSAPVTLFAFDATGMVLQAEGKVLPTRADGRTIEVGASVFDCRADEGDFGTALRTSLDGQPLVATFRFGVRYLEVTLHPTGPPGNRPLQVIGVVVDVTAYREALAAVRDREERLRSIVDAVLDGIIVVDGLGRVESMNPAAARMFGYSAGMVIGRPVASLMPVLDQLDRLEMQESGSWRAESEGLRRDGGSFPIDLAIKAMTRGGRRLTIATVKDVTDQKLAESELRRSQERYALAARGSTDGLWDWDLTGNSFYYSPRWLEILGLQKTALKPAAEEWFRRIHPEDVARVSAAIDAHLGGETAHFESEHRMRHADASFRWVLIRGMVVRDAAGEPTRMAGSLSDVTDRREAEHRRVHELTHDAMTGLPNRMLLLDRISRIQATRRRPSEPEDGRQRFALLLVDLDRFKLINESLGYPSGDQVLVAVARRIEPMLQEADTVARLGSDEFAILIDDAGSGDGVMDFAEQLRRSIAAPIQVDASRVVVDASVGVIIDPGDRDPADILRDAELAMFRSKGDGGGRITRFSEQFRSETATFWQSETQLRMGIESGGVRVHYQPIVRIGCGSVAGFEALVRMMLPTGEMLPPGDFIPVAEQTGLILPLGMEVLRQASAQAATWDAMFDDELTVAVNLSSRQIENAEAVGDIADVIGASAGARVRLKLEVTESGLIKNPELAASRLAALRDKGVQICIDDFGTGYSSLAYLHRYPVDVLKIDRFFIGRMVEHRRDFELMRGIIALAHNLGMVVVAEGVETSAQAAALAEMGCEYGQGYYFGRPMPAEKATEWLSSRLAPSARPSPIAAN